MLVFKDHVGIITSDPAPLLQALPMAKSAPYKDSFVVAVPDHPECLQVVSNMGYEVEGTIRRRYKWPRKPGWEARWFQTATSEFMTLNRRGFVLSGMRVGKTLAALWALDHLQRTGCVKKALIVAPLSAMELAWADTIYSCFHHRKYAVLYGPKAKRGALLEQDRDIYIINHDGVGVILGELLGKVDINCVIIDEVHEYKGGSGTLKWRNLNTLLNKSGRIEYCWGLTGTPTPQAPTDAYGQSRLVTPDNYTKSFTRFKMDTMLQVGPFKWVPRAESEKVVKSILSPSIRFGREVVTSMEPCLIERHAELSKEQEQHYKALRKKAVTEIAGKQITAVNAAVLVQKLVQTACISGETEVLCSRGWVPINKVIPLDRVWDGVEWVEHAGNVCKGTRPTIECGSMRMTPDHKVLTNCGWMTAEAFNGQAGNRITWKKVWIPNSGKATRDCGTGGRFMGVSMRLRKHSYPRRGGSTRYPKETSSELRMRTLKKSISHREEVRVLNRNPSGRTKGCRNAPKGCLPLCMREGGNPFRIHFRKSPRKTLTKLWVQNPKQRYDGAAFWDINRSAPSNSRTEQSVSALVGLPVRLRERGNPNRIQSRKRRTTDRRALWVPRKPRMPDTWQNRNFSFQYMVKDEATLQLRPRQGLEKLWRKGNKSMPQVGKRFPGVLERYGCYIQERINIRPHKQRTRIFSQKLPLGFSKRAIQKQEIKCIDCHPEGDYACVPGGRGVWIESSNTSCPDIPIQMARATSATYSHRLQERETVKVYDLLNCGPRNRFVVRGVDKVPRIVHNCGCVYDAEGNFLEIDFGPRLAVLEELIEQNEEKVLVFVPFTGALNAIARELRKRWTVAVVDGSVSAGARDKIFRAFQGGKDPHVIVAHPGTMAYSLDLTAASLIVWYAPPAGGAKIYQQACARIDGGAQKVKIDIAHISGIPEERRAYSVVQGKGRWQEILLDLS